MCCTGAPPAVAAAGSATVRATIFFGWPSTQYTVGSLGSSLSSYSVKRLPVDTVWVQATSLLKPIDTTGLRPPVAPITSSWPGMVRCICQKRLVPFQGKCGLPSSRPLPSGVALRPKAQPLEPSSPPSGLALKLWRPISATACSSATGAAPVLAPGAGGTAASTAPASAPRPPWIIDCSVARARSAAVIGRTQGLPRQASGRPLGPASCR
ncbi:hypothetical protein D3C72_1342610 [compost metagenome]